MSNSEDLSEVKKDPLGARVTFESGYGSAYMYSLSKLMENGYSNINNLPFSIKVLLEAVLRECDGYVVSEEDVKKLANYDPKNPGEEEIPFKPARVILQDFTGVPVVVDLAALRSAMARMGGDPKNNLNGVVNFNLIPCQD